MELVVEPFDILEWRDDLLQVVVLCHVVNRGENQARGGTCVTCSFPKIG